MNRTCCLFVKFHNGKGYRHCCECVATLDTRRQCVVLPPTRRSQRLFSFSSRHDQAQPRLTAFRPGRATAGHQASASAYAGPSGCWFPRNSLREPLRVCDLNHRLAVIGSIVWPLARLSC